MQRGKTKADHQHLLVREFLAKIRGRRIDFRERLKEKSIDYYSLTQEKRKEILTQVVRQIKESEEGHELYQEIKQSLKTQIELISSSEGRKQLHLIDCFRQASIYPLVPNREKQALNLQILHGITIKKQLRRVIWSRIFNTDRFRMLFSKWDREVTPYKLQEELSVSMEKISANHDVRLKDNQIQCALRIIQYFIKSQERLPQKYVFFISLTVVDLYSFTKIEKVIDLGAVSLGIVELLQYYNQPIEIRLNNLKKVLHIIDSESYDFIEQNYFQSASSDKDIKEFLQSFEMFRLTGGSYFLPLESAQFIVDQLLIRKKCKIDLYSHFSIMILIMSDELEPGFKKGLSFKEIFEHSRTTIKKEEFVQAYNVIYQNIPPCFNSDDLVKHPNNRLLSEMLSCERQQKVIEEDVDENFELVIQNLNIPLRMGVKM